MDLDPKDGQPMTSNVTNKMEKTRDQMIIATLLDGYDKIEDAYIKFKPNDDDYEMGFEAGLAAARRITIEASHQARQIPHQAEQVPHQKGEPTSKKYSWLIRLSKPRLEFWGNVYDNEADAVKGVNDALGLIPKERCELSMIGRVSQFPQEDGEVLHGLIGGVTSY